MFVFGAGKIFAIPLSDALGNDIATPTPVQIGTMQEMTLDFSGDSKELYGDKQFAVAIARGKVKVDGKFKGAKLSGRTLNSLFFGQTITDGTMGSIREADTPTVIPATPHAITPTYAPGTFVADMGVLDAAGQPMTRVAASPATGEYSVSGSGVYTFATADEGDSVFINYHTTISGVAAGHIAVKNLPMGYAPKFKAFMQTTFEGKRALVILHACVAAKLAMFSTKLDDFSVPEIAYTGQSDAADNVAEIYIQE